MNFFNKNINRKIENDKAIKIIVNIFLGIIILLGIGTSIKMLVVNRSLWFDEACFAFSFSQRNIFELIKSPFEWDQTAPAIYLYIVKIITLLFGNNEITLRLFSVISYLMILVLSYLISKNIFKFKFPLFSVAYISSVYIILQYSNIFKPYIFDAAMYLVIIYIYYLYKEKKMNYILFIIISSISIWASNPTLFIIGGIFIYELILGIKSKDYKYIKNIVIGGGIVLISFAVYYILWLQQTADSPGMLNFWKDYNFPLIPLNIKDLTLGATLIEYIVNELDNFEFLVFGIATASVIIGLIKKDNIKTVIFFSIILALIASYIKKFPIQSRLWLFIYPITIICMFDALNSLITKDNKKNIIIIVLGMILILSNNGIKCFFKTENIYYPGNEINMVIDYLEKNIKEDEKIYLSNESVAAFMYKNGYNKYTFGKNNNQIIIPSVTGMFIDYDENSIEINKIKDEEKIYILNYFRRDELEKNMYKLSRIGNLELVYEPHETPLYYYTKNKNNVKTKIEYFINNVKYENGEYNIEIGIKNIGETIINNRFEKICLRSKQKEEFCKLITNQLYPNKTYILKFDIELSEDEEIELQLMNEGKYWYDEIGIKPLKINKEILEKNLNIVKSH